jgi:hypothetical protein
MLILSRVTGAQYGGGSGTADDPYLIYTAEQLNAIGADPNDWDKHFALMADIDLSAFGSAGYNIIGRAWEKPFRGVFDGNGHVIANLTWRDAYARAGGLFGWVAAPDSEIRNLTLARPDIHVGPWGSAGALVGNLQSGTVTDCHVTDANVTGEFTAGGLAGRNGGTVTNSSLVGVIVGDEYTGGLVGTNAGIIRNCEAHVTVEGGYRIGGLVGENEATVTACTVTATITGVSSVAGIAGANMGTIERCTVIGGDVEGTVSVGGLAGANWDGTIRCSEAAVSVVGRETAGGLVGHNHGKILCCWTNGNVEGHSHIGGLVGENRGRVIYCYTTGSTKGHQLIGGLAGEGDHGQITSCYVSGRVGGEQWVGALVGGQPPGMGGTHTSFWNVETNPYADAEGGIGVTAAAMRDPNTYIQAGWDFFGPADGPSDVWAMDPDAGSPVLWWQIDEESQPELPKFSGGIGTAEDPYLIRSAECLNQIGHNPGLMASHFALIEDIDLSGTDFHMIGTEALPFAGVFDGRNRTVSRFGLRHDGPLHAGLFGYISGPDAIVTRLGIVEPNVVSAADQSTGSLVGCLEAGTVFECYAGQGLVSGSGPIGGLVGLSHSGTIRDSHSACTVSGQGIAGGLIGWNEYGTVTGSFASGDTTGDTSVGGLAGRNGGSVTNCYASGGVAGNDEVGGLIGRNFRNHDAMAMYCYARGAVIGTHNVAGLIGRNDGRWTRHCFWDSETTGQAHNRGGTGLTTAEMWDVDTYLEAGWDFIGETENGVEDIWWMEDGAGYPRLWWELGAVDAAVGAAGL